MLSPDFSFRFSSHIPVLPFSEPQDGIVSAGAAIDSIAWSFALHMP
jgi:hypothetical protein